MGALHFPSLRKRREITAQIEVQELEKKTAKEYRPRKHTAL
jgi:hypothetical protein